MTDTAGSTTRSNLIILTVIGTLLLILAFIHVAISFMTDHPEPMMISVELVLLGGPPIGLFGIIYKIRTINLPKGLVRSVVIWSVGGAATVLLVVILSMWQAQASHWSHQALFSYQLGTGLGAVGGAAVGFNQARAVTRAQEVSLTKAQRDRLEYLNHLIRHDINNKLGIINGNIELVIEKADREIVEQLETIRQQSEEAAALLRRVRVLLQASQQGQTLEPINLTEAIETEVTQLRAAYPDATITTELPGDLMVRADELVGSVFENLIRNGIEHNDSESPEVRVSGTAGGETVNVTVTDNGPGIPADFRDALFTPSEEGDHGFGMYLVDTLVDQYDGEISVRETGPSGTTIAVELNRD